VKSKSPSWRKEPVQSRDIRYSRGARPQRAKRLLVNSQAKHYDFVCNLEEAMRSIGLCAAVWILYCGFTQAQSQYQVLYSFAQQGSNDAAYPNAGLVADGKGNLYGTSSIGGMAGGNGETGCLFGTVFELSPQSDGTWTEVVLHSFCSTFDIETCPDGADPSAGLLRGRGGSFFGTTGGEVLMGWGSFLNFPLPRFLAANGPKHRFGVSAPRAAFALMECIPLRS
jgi:hypothetical protein